MKFDKIANQIIQENLILNELTDWKIKEIGEEERNFEANERRQRELENGTWYLRIDGKIFRDKTTKEPAAFNGKKHANAVANKMSALEFNKGKKFMLTRKPEDKPEEYPQRT